jgi:hypothetical protein
MTNDLDPLQPSSLALFETTILDDVNVDTRT